MQPNKKPSMYELDVANGWKICKYCKEKLPISQFALCKLKAKDESPARAWYNPKCKKCKATYYKNKWHTDPEYRKRKLARIRDYQQTHKEQIRAHILKYVKKWQKGNRDKIRLIRSSPKWKAADKRRHRIKSINAAIERLKNKGNTKEEINYYLHRFWTDEEIKEAIEKGKK